jgi:hypothetical protein
MNFGRKNPYQDLVSAQDLPRRRSRCCNGKIEPVTDGMIVGMTVYSWDDSCSKQVGTNIIKISKANYWDDPTLCMNIVIEALVSLPAGFYTVVYHTKPLPCAMEFRVGGEVGKLRVKPLDRETINSIKQPACLRVVVD